MVQWNINGLYAHIEKFQLLVKESHPLAICIQETNFKGNSNYKLSNYSCFKKNRPDQNIASGGVATYISEECNSTQIHLDTALEAIATSFSYKSIRINIINLYIPPNKTITLNELQSVIEQVPAPRIIVGDMNAHNTIWGSTNTDRRGKLIEELLDKTSLILLNTGNSTRFNAHTGNFSSIDLTLCDPTIAPELSWNTKSYLGCGRKFTAFT